jgi:hypothetical protein
VYALPSYGKALSDKRSCFQIPGTEGAEIEQGVRDRLRPWLEKKKLAIARKVRSLPPPALTIADVAR